MKIFTLFICAVLTAEATREVVDYNQLLDTVQLVYREKRNEKPFEIICDGVAVSIYWILTLSSCMDDTENIEQWYIRTGGESWPFFARIKKTQTHGVFKLVKLDNRPMHQHIKLNEEIPLWEGQLVLSVGTLRDPSKDLQKLKVDMKTIPPSECSSIYKDLLSKRGLKESDVLCAREITHTYSCDLDIVGAPLIKHATETLLGIAVEKDSQCKDKNATYIFYLIGPHEKWLTETTKS